VSELTLRKYDTISGER